MASLTYTTNAQEDRAIAWFLAKRNANQLADWQAQVAATPAGQTPPPQPPDLTASDIVSELLRGFLADKLRSARGEDADAVRAAFDSATAAKQAQVKAALGL